MTELRDAGIDPFGHRFDRTHMASELHTLYDDVSGEDLETQANEVAIAGRMMTKRRSGKISFADIKDRSGRIQVFVQKPVVGEDIYEWFKNLIWVTG